MSLLAYHAEVEPQDAGAGLVLDLVLDALADALRVAREMDGHRDRKAIRPLLRVGLGRVVRVVLDPAGECGDPLLGCLL